MFKRAAMAAAFYAFTGAASASPLLFSEGFDDVSALASHGWTLLNKSARPVDGSQPWMQGNAALFSARGGAGASYAMANYTSSVDGTLAQTGSVENWLITPTLSWTGSVVLEFFVRGEGQPGWADGLEVRGGRLDAVTGQVVFDTLIGAINPLLQVDGLPADWTHYSFNASFDTPFNGPLAFVHRADGADANLMALD